MKRLARWTVRIYLNRISKLTGIHIIKSANSRLMILKMGPQDIKQYLSLDKYLRNIEYQPRNFIFYLIYNRKINNSRKSTKGSSSSSEIMSIYSTPGKKHTTAARESSQSEEIFPNSKKASVY